jgi:hypothetical protein
MSSVANVIGFFNGINMLGIVTWFILALHMGYTRIDEILRNFDNSPIVKGFAPYRNEGPARMIWLIGAITAIVTFPTFHLRNGELSESDLRSLPLALRRRFVVMHWALLTLIAGAIVFGVSAGVWKKWGNG